jgi:hypothetical protein
VRWRVAYHEGGGVAFRNASGAWRDLPTQRVLWVDLAWGPWRQRLAGRDNFWLHGDTFGLFNDPENLSVYGGDPRAQASAWRATTDGSIPISPIPPAGAHVLAGILLPDETWGEVTRAHPLVLA